MTEILTEMTRERGALPLLAFAAARLWDKRNREKKLLTREAYLEIGGVGGALARHAEATLDRIGRQRIPIVREIFRNLVTARGIRATRDMDELLSLFENREVARQVIRIRGRWLVTAHVNDAAFWPIDREFPLVLKGHEGRVMDIIFTPEGKHLVSASADGHGSSVAPRAW